MHFPIAEKRRLQLPLALLSLAFLFVASVAAEPPRCLFVSSYHQGYAWSDGVEKGLRETLQDKCELRQFDMDTKRRKNDADKKAAALQAKSIIESWHPDVVITADDNAAKYLIQDHYRDAKLPFVFCGVNWTVKEYGFPYSNATGMIETAPVQAMIDEARALVSGASRVMYLGARTATEIKNAARVRRAVEQGGLQFEQRLASSQADWIEAYRAGQDYDFVIIGSNAGIQDWDMAKVLETILPLTRRLSLTSHEWMMPISMLGMTKVPEEQGEWAGQVALQILEGTEPGTIPVIANRKWDLFLNPRLIEAADFELTPQLEGKGKIYR